MRCPYCNGIDYDEFDYEEDEDGCTIYTEYICNECGCEFSVENAVKIIKEGGDLKNKDESKEEI